MNNLKDKAVLIVYDSSNAVYQDYAGAVVAYEASGWTADLIDIDGLDDTVGGAAAVATLIAALTDATYDKIVITCAISDTGGSESMSYDSIAACWAKLKTSAKGTALTTGTAQAAGSDTTHTELENTAVVTEDYYNTCIITTDGASSGLAQTKLILNQAAATYICEVGGAAQTATDGDAYAVYAAENILIGQDPSYLIANAYKYDAVITDYYTIHTLFPIMKIVWDFVRTNSVTGVINTPPRIIHCTSSTLYDKLTLTCSGAGAATTLVDAGAFTADAHVGQYVYIISGTGAGQWAQIASNTTGALTCQYFNNKDENGFPNYRNSPTGGDAAWTTNLDGTSVYTILDGFAEILNLEYYQLYIKAFLSDITDPLTQQIWENLLDKGQYLSDDLSKVGPPIQDEDAINTALEKGQAIYKGVLVSAALT
jgi:hypothetical protein